MTLTTMLVSLALVAQAQVPARVVTGEVVDPSGLAMPGAVISIKGTTSLAVSDERGHFNLAMPITDAVLVIEMPGFKTKEIPVKNNDVGAVPLRITLELSQITDDVVVRAPAVNSAPDARLPLRPLDIVRTAGAQADVMRAVAVLPGVAQIDEGAGLFVRGGDVSETLVLLDTVPVRHPYRYETPTGGFRGAIDPFLTQGVSFTTGGFSAEYGNSLSAVLDMRGLGRPTSVRITGTAGLAGVAGMLAQPIGSNAGVRVGVNRTTPRLLFAVNTPPREFDRLPGGWDVSASADAASARLGTLHVFVLEQRDHVGVKLEQDGFAGFLHSGSSHRLLTMTWQRPLPAGWSATGAAGLDRRSGTTDLGVFAVTEADRGLTGRIDLGGPFGAWRLRTGAEVGHVVTSALGEVPRRGGDFGGVSGVRVFEVEHDDTYIGAYAEATRTIGRFIPTVGLRTEHFRVAGAKRFDPRINLAYDLGTPGRLRFAWGRYHQAPSSQYFDTVAGSRVLQPMAATHYVAGYEVGRIEQATFFRAEAYVKTYGNLPVDDPAGGYNDSGYGHARGVDLFLRRVWHFIDVRASASFVDTARRWTPAAQQARYPLPEGTWAPDFSVPFLWQVVANVPLARSVSAGIAWHQAAGRPFTPVVSAIETARGFEPVWGPINLERLPRYERLDLSLSKTRTFGTRTLAVFFVSMNNALGRRNFFQYAYSTDFRERRPVAAASPRSWYIGCSFTR